MPLKALIVDDESIARNLLREELESIPDVLIAAKRPAGRPRSRRSSGCGPTCCCSICKCPAWAAST